MVLFAWKVSIYHLRKGDRLFTGLHKCYCISLLDSLIVDSTC